MDGSKRMWLVGVSGLLVGALLGAGVAWYVQQQRLDDLEQRAATVASQRTRLESMQTLLEEKDRMLEQVSERYNELASRMTSSTAMHGTGDATSAPSDKPVRQFAYIKSISIAPNPSLKADYAQFLTGQAAIDAAKKAGGESPPPNDYYIVNESARIRTLPVSSTVRVTLTTKPGEGPVVDGYAANLKTLAGYLGSNSEETAGLRADGFWLTVDKGTVTAIEEQYVP